MNNGNTLANKAPRKAFTLIEVLIVMGILAMLMGFVVSMFGTAGQAQGRARASADMEVMAQGLEAFSGTFGGYPRLNATSGEKTVAGDLYKCLVGKKSLRIQDNSVVMADLGKPRAPFVDAVKLRIADPANPDSQDVDPERNGVFFADPWGEPYLYYYDSSTNLGTVNSTWRAPGFVLLSKGADRQSADVQSLCTTGIMPDFDDYISKMENVDNIIQGIQE